MNLLHGDNYEINPNPLYHHLCHSTLAKKYLETDKRISRLYITMEKEMKMDKEYRKMMFRNCQFHIEILIKDKHKGIKNAIKRIDLMAYVVKHIWKDIQCLPDPDRELRKIYSGLPVISGSWGICWPETSEDLDRFSDYMKSKAIAHFARAKKVAEQHPQLLSERYIHQLGLFEELGATE